MRKNILLLLHSVLYLLSLVIWPTWLAPPTLAGRYTMLAGILCMWLGSVYLIVRYYPNRATSEEKPHILWSHKLTLFVLFSIIILILVPILNKPIRARGDEPVHAQQGSIILEQSVYKIQNALELPLQLILKILAWTIVLVLAALHLFRRQKLKKWFRAVAEKYSERLFTINFMIVILVGLYSTAILKAIAGIPYTNIWYIIVPYEGLNILFTSINIILTGYSEFWLRIPYTLMLFAGAVFIYKTASLFSNKRVALWSAALFSAFPLSMFYAQIIKPTTGEVLVVIASMFYFTRFLKEKNKTDLWIAAFISAVGVHFKMSSMFALFVIAVYASLSWIYDCSKEKKILAVTKEYAQTYMPPLLLFASFYIPRFYVAQAYSFVPFPNSSWLTWSGYTIHHLTTYAKMLPFQITWAGTALLAAGILLIILKRDRYRMLLLTWILTIYLILSSHKVYHVSRWAMVYLPALAIIIALCIDSIPQKALSWSVFLIAAVFIVLGGHSSVYFPNYDNQFLPFDQAYEWIATESDSSKAVYELMPPYNFYDRKWELKNKIIIGQFASKDNQTIELLREYADKNDIGYILIPAGNVSHGTANLYPIGPFSPSDYSAYFLGLNNQSCTYGQYNQEMISQIINQEKGFKVAARFTHADNQLLVVET